MRDVPRIFRDRSHAGALLAERLAAFRAAPGAVVLGLPRGGVVPAAEIAAALELPLDVILARKLRAPYNPELAIGAVAEGGEPFLYEEAIRATGASRSYVADEIACQRREIAERQRLFRNGEPLRLPPHATVLLVDDGIATGSTVIAAIGSLRDQDVARLVVAAAVAPPETVARLNESADDVVVLISPARFGSVSQFYESFPQVSDEEVAALLARRPERDRPQAQAC